MTILRLTELFEQDWDGPQQQAVKHGLAQRLVARRHAAEPRVPRELGDGSLQQVAAVAAAIH